MSYESHDNSQSPHVDVTANMVHTVMHFVWLVQRRWQLVAAATAVAALFGALHYGTAPRIYSSSAQLLIRSSIAEPTGGTVASDRWLQDQMATHEKVITSDAVLRDVVEEWLEDGDPLPPELVGIASEDAMLAALSRMLQTQVLRRTSIIQLACRSTDPVSSMRVAADVSTRFQEYMTATHKQAAQDLIVQLRDEEEKLNDDVNRVEFELMAARKEAQDLGIEQNSQTVHPTIQKVTKLNDALVEIRERRAQIEATLAAVRQTVRSGGD
ncbi:MAG: hypothetical protein KDA99_25400 [Planctomycetales bacterium]|nr:hypothetical protein [Planctomycetales bacterium]